MSIKVMNKVWENSQCGGTELLLLIALADWADDWGYCYPSIDQMARKIRQTKRNVINLLQKLEGIGELRMVKRASGGRGIKIGSIYQVTCGMSQEQIADSERLSPIAIKALETPENFSPVSGQNQKTRENFSPVSQKNRENFSPVSQKTSENFTPVSGQKRETGENSGPEISPVLRSTLNELINVKDINVKHRGIVVEEEVNLINSSATKNFSASSPAAPAPVSPQKVQSAVSQNQPSPLSQASENNNGAKTRYSAPTGIDAEALYRKIRPTHVTIPSNTNPLHAIEVLKRYLQLYQNLDAAANALRPFAQEADRRGIRETNLCWLTEWAAVGKIPPTTKNTGRYKREMSRPLNPTPSPPQQKEYDYENWPWEWKHYDSIMKYGEATIPEEQIRHMAGDDVILFMHQTLAKKLPEGLEPGQTLRICFDDDNIVEGELEEIIYSTLHPEYITHLVVDGEAIDALQLVEAKEIKHVP